jgi:hypothetical protein
MNQVAPEEQNARYQRSGFGEKDLKYRISTRMETDLRQRDWRCDDPSSSSDLRYNVAISRCATHGHRHTSSHLIMSSCY